MKDTLLWTSGAIAALLVVAMGIYLRDLDPGLLRLQFTWSQTAFESVITQWSGEETARFRHHFMLDYAFIVAYATFGYLLGRRYRSPLLRWLLPFAGCFDFCENQLQLFLLNLRQFNLHVDVYLFAGIAATAKWLLVLAFAALLALQRRR